MSAVTGRYACIRAHNTKNIKPKPLKIKKRMRRGIFFAPLSNSGLHVLNAILDGSEHDVPLFFSSGHVKGGVTSALHLGDAEQLTVSLKSRSRSDAEGIARALGWVASIGVGMGVVMLRRLGVIAEDGVEERYSSDIASLKHELMSSGDGSASRSVAAELLETVDMDECVSQLALWRSCAKPDNRYSAVSLFVLANGTLDTRRLSQCVNGSFEEWFSTIDGSSMRVAYILSIGEMLPSLETHMMYMGEDGEIPDTTELLRNGELPYPFQCSVDTGCSSRGGISWTQRFPGSDFRGSVCQCISEYDAWSRFFDREFSTGGRGVGPVSRMVLMSRGGVMPSEQEFSVVTPLSRYSGETRITMERDCIRNARNGRDKEPGDGLTVQINVPFYNFMREKTENMVDFELEGAVLVRLSPLDPDNFIVTDRRGEAGKVAIDACRFKKSVNGPLACIPGSHVVIDRGADLSVEVPRSVSKWDQVCIAAVAGGGGSWYRPKVRFLFGMRDLRSASLDVKGGGTSTRAASAVASLGAMVEWTKELLDGPQGLIERLIDRGQLTFNGEVVKWMFGRSKTRTCGLSVMRCSGCGRVPGSVTEAHYSGLLRVLMGRVFAEDTDDARYMMPSDVPDDHLVDGIPVKGDVDMSILDSHTRESGIARAAEGYQNLVTSASYVEGLMKDMLRPIGMQVNVLTAGDAASMIKEASRSYDFVSRVSGTVWTRGGASRGCVASGVDTVRFSVIWKLRYDEYAPTSSEDKLLLLFFVEYVQFFGSSPPMNILCTLAAKSKDGHTELEGHVRLDDVWDIMGEMCRMSGTRPIDKSSNHARRIFGNGSLDPVPENRRAYLSRKLISLAVSASSSGVTGSPFGVSIGENVIRASDILSPDFVTCSLGTAHGMVVERMSYVHNVRISEIAEVALSRGFVGTLLARQDAYLVDAARGAEVLMPVYLEAMGRLETPYEVFCRVDDRGSMRDRTGGRGYMSMIDQFVQIGRRVWTEVHWMFSKIPGPSAIDGKVLARRSDLQDRFMDAAMHVLFSPAGGILPFSSTSMTDTGYERMLESQFPHLVSQVPVSTPAPEWHAGIGCIVDTTRAFSESIDDTHGPVYEYADMSHRWVSALAGTSASLRFLTKTDKDIVRNIGMGGFSPLEGSGGYLHCPIHAKQELNVHAPETLGTSTPGMRALSVVERLARDACMLQDELPKGYESKVDRTKSTIMSVTHSDRFIVLGHNFVSFFMRNIDGLIVDDSVIVDSMSTNGCDAFICKRTTVSSDVGDSAMGFDNDAEKQTKMGYAREIDDMIGAYSSGFDVPDVKDARFEVLSHGTVMVSSSHDGIRTVNESSEDGKTGPRRFFRSLGGTRTERVLSPVCSTGKGKGVDRDIGSTKTAWGMGLSTGRAFRHPVLRSCVMVATYEGFVPFPLLVDEQYYLEVLSSVLLSFDPKDREFYIRRGTSPRILLREDVPRFFKLSKGNYVWEHTGGVFDFRKVSYYAIPRNKETISAARKEKRKLEDDVDSSDSGKKTRGSLPRPMGGRGAVVYPKGTCVLCGHVEQAGA